MPAPREIQAAETKRVSWVRIETQVAAWRDRLDSVLLRRWVQVILFFGVLCLAWLCSPGVAHAEIPAPTLLAPSQA